MNPHELKATARALGGVVAMLASVAAVLVLAYAGIATVQHYADAYAVHAAPVCAEVAP